MNDSVKVLSDGMADLRKELINLKNQMDGLKQVYLKLEQEYLTKRARYEVIDRQWAERDGRLKVSKVSKEKPKEEKALTPEQLSNLIAELEDMV